MIVTLRIRPVGQIEKLALFRASSDVVSFANRFECMCCACVRERQGERQRQRDR